MLSKREQYKPPTEYLFLYQKRKMEIIKRISKQITKFDITMKKIGFGNSLSINEKFLR